MTVLAVLTVFGGSGEHLRLALLCLSYKIQCQETTVTVSAVPVVTATPLKLNPPFSVILTNSLKVGPTNP